MMDKIFYNNQRFTELKKRIFTILLPVFIIGFTLIFAIVVHNRALGLVNLITFGTLCIGLTVIYLCMLHKNSNFRYIESAITFIGMFIFLLRMYSNLIFDLGRNGYSDIGTVSYWVSLLFILLFFTFRGKMALAISLFIYLLILIPGIYHIFFSGFVNGDTLDTLIQFFLSTFGYIIALYYFQRVIEIYLQAEVAHHRAHTDYLTELPNRRKMDLQLHMEIELARHNSTSLSVVLFDVDYFKKVNDTFGHDVGDSILKELAQLVQNFLPQTDYFGRWGGEEFLWIGKDKNLFDIKTEAESLRVLIESHDFISVGTLTCSFGASELHEKDLAKDLLKRADEALYMAKEHGRNKVIASSILS
ncbi:MAG: GGDEF domain-containing protein [Bacillota bacterium]|nr:GGDEF domain-containing protein [Bacillota bacterium]